LRDAFIEEKKSLRIELYEIIQTAGEEKEYGKMS
jgi:hypothetical protein